MAPFQMQDPLCACRHPALICVTLVFGCRMHTPAEMLTILQTFSGTAPPPCLLARYPGLVPPELLSLRESLPYNIARAGHKKAMSRLCSLCKAYASSRSTCGARWKDQTHHTRSWRSTSAGRWTAKPEWTLQSRQNTYAPEAPPPAQTERQGSPP